MASLDSYNDSSKGTSSILKVSTDSDTQNNKVSLYNADQLKALKSRLREKCLDVATREKCTDVATIPWPEDFDISFKTAFVFEDPLTELPTYFTVWNELGKNLPELVEHHTLRDFVHQMPELDQSNLTGSREKWLAYVILGISAGAYVWLERDEGVTEILPRQLAVPLCGICEDLQTPHISIFASVITANWRLIDSNGPMDYSNLEPIVGLYPRSSFGGFVNVHIMVEQTFAQALPAVLEGFHAMLTDDVDLLTTSLKTISIVIKEMTYQLSQIYEQCDAWEMFHDIRHLLQGWYYNNCPLPDGLIYEGVLSTPKKLFAGSGAQSSTFQTLDILLGIQHDIEKQKVIMQMRKHIPQRHSAFLADLTKLPSAKSYVSSSDNEDLKAAYNSCLSELASYKSVHIRVVAKYISAQKPKKEPNERQYSDNKGIWSDKAEIFKWLKGFRDDVQKEKM